MSGVILYLEFRDLCILQVYISIFYAMVSKDFFAQLYDIKFSFPIQMILNGSIWALDWILTYTTTPNQSGTGSNNTEGMNPNSLELHKWNLTTRCSLVSYPEYHFWGEGVPVSGGVQSAYSKTHWLSG